MKTARGCLERPKMNVRDGFGVTDGTRGPLLIALENQLIRNVSSLSNIDEYVY